MICNSFVFSLRDFIPRVISIRIKDNTYTNAFTKDIIIEVFLLNANSSSTFLPYSGLTVPIGGNNAFFFL